MLKQTLLHKLESGFSYNTLSEVQKDCSSYLDESKQSDSLFVYLIRDICFRVGEHLDQLQPVTVDIHQIIEKTIMEPLTTSINSLGTDDLGKQVELFNDLISAYQDVMKIR